MTPDEEFTKQCNSEVHDMSTDPELHDLTQRWFTKANTFNYSYHFAAMGRPVIQYPQDLIALQEIIHQVRPDVVIETGIARGGSLIHSASQLALLDVVDAIASGSTINPRISQRRVVGIDIDIREHNRAAIEAHPMSSRIEMIQGSSVDPRVVERVTSFIKPDRTVLVLLDSNHTHQHALAELRAYAPLVSTGSYCVVYDTVIEHLPEGSFPDRPWEIGDNPMTAITEFLQNHPEFQVDESISDKLQITVAPKGYLRRVS